MQVSWIFILFLTTLALAVVFATLSFLRTRKKYKDNNPGTEPLEAPHLKDRAEDGDSLRT